MTSTPRKISSKICPRLSSGSNSWRRSVRLISSSSVRTWAKSAGIVPANSSTSRTRSEIWSADSTSKYPRSVSAMSCSKASFSSANCANRVLMSGSDSRERFSNESAIEWIRAADTAECGCCQLSTESRALSVVALGSMVSPVTALPGRRTSQPAFTQSVM